jgi:D-threo-aldose 1-dehydrogenase
LVKLRDEGVIDHIGVAGGPIDLMLQYLATGLFEAAISHNRYTLVDQSAEPLMEDARRRNIAFVNAAPFGGGMLVKGPDLQPKYCYARASQATLTRVHKMEQLCKAHDVPLAAAALQFSLRNNKVVSTIVGMSESQRIAQTLKLADWPIPEDLWTELRDLAVQGRDN